MKNLQLQQISINELLTELSQRQITLRLDNGQLSIRAPQGALTQELKQIIAEKKADIISILKQIYEIDEKRVPTIATISKNQKLPLSLTQELLVNVLNLQAESAVYNLSTVLHLVGSLNVSILKKSISEIVSRHEILRTSFERKEVEVVQNIANDFTVELPILDLRNLPSEQRAAEVKRLATQQVQQPFEIMNNLLWRVQLLHLSEDEYVLILVMHHLIADGWSFKIFFQELSTLYQAFCHIQPSSLSTLPIQYADFALWQRQGLESSFFESQINYWQQQLEGYSCPLQLPYDFSAWFPTYRGEYHGFEFSENTLQQLKEFSQQEGVTLFMTLLAAFQTLLYSYTEQEDILICSPMAGRTLTETESLIGYFNNIIPMRSHLNNNLTFRELLKQVRIVANGAYEHQNIPLQKLVELSNLGGIPLTKVMFNLEKSASQELKLPGITVKVNKIHNGSANFDLSLILEENDNTLTGIWNYKTDLFSATTISRLENNFKKLIADLIANPDQPLSAFLETIPGEVRSCQKLDTDTKTSYIAPKNQLERELVMLWESYLKVKPIGIKDNFFALGGHSLLALQLFTQIEQKYQKNIGLASLSQAPTIEQQAKLLQTTHDSTNWSSLVPIQTQGNKPPLFCIHAVGGNILTYLRLSNYLGTDQPVYGLQAQGLDGKSLFHTSIEEMATHYIQEIRASFPQGPYLLGGLSGGGVIAFEIAQQLQAEGQEVALVALFDSYNPEYIRMRTKAHAEFIRQKNLTFIVFLRKKLKLQKMFQIFRKFWRTLAFLFSYQVKFQEKSNYTVQVFQSIKKEIKNTFEVLTYRILGNNKSTIPYSMRMNLITNNVRNAVKKYFCKKYNGRVVLFRANHSIYVINGEPDSEDLGWKEVITGELEIYRISGAHNTILDEPHVQILANQLKTCIKAMP